MNQEFQHIPVMLQECMDILQLKDGSVYCDCTLGGAGHSIVASKLIAPNGILIGIDQDDFALAAAKERLMEAGMHTPPVLLKGNFGNLDALLTQAQVPGVDAFLFDIGVSSPQFDLAERGFSYREDAPLDMRMDTTHNFVTAADILATYSEKELTRILREYSDEKWAARIANFVCNQRDTEPIETTGQLVDLIKRAIPAKARKDGGHPAKRTFQALRVEVNHELDVLRSGLEAAIRWLNPGGRVAVLSYQSLEDKIVKEMFKEYANPCTCPPELPMCMCNKKAKVKVITRKPMLPSDSEIKENNRAHSARLRVAEKI